MLLMRVVFGFLIKIKKDVGKCTYCVCLIKGKKFFQSPASLEIRNLQHLHTTVHTQLLFKSLFHFIKELV